MGFHIECPISRFLLAQALQDSLMLTLDFILSSVVRCTKSGDQEIGRREMWCHGIGLMCHAGVAVICGVIHFRRIELSWQMKIAESDRRMKDATLSSCRGSSLSSLILLACYTLFKTRIYNTMNFFLQLKGHSTILTRRCRNFYSGHQIDSNTLWERQLMCQWAFELMVWHKSRIELFSRFWIFHGRFWREILIDFDIWSDVWFKMMSSPE